MNISAPVAFACLKKHRVQTSRRLLWSHGIFAASLLTSSSSKAARLFKNLDDAREAGDVLREEKDRAEGPIITLPSGVKFREIEQGTGREVLVGDVVTIQFIIYSLNGFYLDSLGYGKEGKDDVGETLSFELGSGTVPRAIELGLKGMRVGGKRRILVRPESGWTSENYLPRPTTTGAQRRLANNSKKPILFEMELVKVGDPLQQSPIAR